MLIIIYRSWCKWIVWLWFWEKRWSDESWSCGSIKETRNRAPISSSLVNWSRFYVQGFHDPLFAMIEQCKWKESQVDSFIPLLQIAPGAIWILVTDQQLKNMVCFCTNSEEFLNVRINTKFDLE